MFNMTCISHTKRINKLINQLKTTKRIQVVEVLGQENNLKVLGVRCHRLGVSRVTTLLPLNNSDGKLGCVATCATLRAVY